MLTDYLGCAKVISQLPDVACFLTLSHQWTLPSPKEGCLVSLLFGKAEWKLRALIKDLKWKPVLSAVGWQRGRAVFKGPTD